MAAGVMSQSGTVAAAVGVTWVLKDGLGCVASALAAGLLKILFYPFPSSPFSHLHVYILYSIEHILRKIFSLIRLILNVTLKTSWVPSNSLFKNYYNLSFTQ